MIGRGAVRITAILLGVLAAGLSVGAGDPPPANPETSPVFAPFDDVDQTTNWPAWVRAWSYSGGALVTNQQGNAVAWYVPAEAPEGTGNLYILLDRRILTNDLTMETEFYDATNSSLYVDLVTTNVLAAPVVSNVFGNLMLGSNEFVRIVGDLPLATSAQAAVICIRRGTGLVAIYDIMLYMNTNLSSGAWSSDNFSRTMSPEISSGGLPGEAEIDSTASGSDIAPERLESDASLEQVQSNRITQIAAPIAGGNTIYVDITIGQNRFSGRVPILQSSDGPKNTIAGGLNAATSGDRLIVKDGDYRESVDISGRAIQVLVEGRVDISGSRGLRDYEVPGGEHPPVSTNCP